MLVVCNKQWLEWISLNLRNVDHRLRSSSNLSHCQSMEVNRTSAEFSELSFTDYFDDMQDSLLFAQLLFPEPLSRVYLLFFTLSPLIFRPLCCNTGHWVGPSSRLSAVHRPSGGHPDSLKPVSMLGEIFGFLGKILN